MTPEQVARLELLERLVAAAPDVWRAKAEALRARCAEKAYEHAAYLCIEPARLHEALYQAVLNVPLEEP